MNLLLLHLYDPKNDDAELHHAVVSLSYLFDRRPLRQGVGDPPPTRWPWAAKIGPDEEVVPTDSARQLAAYLLSQHSDTAIFDAQPPQTKAPPSSGTNAPRAMAVTNAPAAAISK